jgi:hypothetical protein
MNAMNDVAAAPDRSRRIDSHVAGPRWLPVIRRLLGYGVVVSVLPYLALKALWLGGVMVGVPEGSPARGAGFVGPNIVTALLDVVAIAVALALTHRWGRRLPAWLVLAPIWVGTGLLIPAAFQVANGAAAAAITGGGAVSLAGGLVEPWAYVVVYTSFGLQALLLTTAFALYARARWAELLDPAGSVAGPGPTRGVQVVLAAAGAVAAGAVAAAHLVMAFGTQGAVTGPYQDGWEYTARSGEVVNAAMAALAVAGIWVMIRRPDAGRRTPVWVAVALTWTGSGAMFAYALLTLLVVAAGVPESDNVTALNGLTQLAALLGGLLIAVTSVVNLAERRPPAVDPDERDTP